MNKLSSALTIDIEDGINISMRDNFSIDMPPTNRVVRNTMILLELFSRYQVKGTFFVLGEVAREFPELVKNISQEGHEVGVHGYSHKQFFKLSYQEAKREIIETKVLLEDLTGKAINGHRAPAFSILPSTSWVLEILADLGIKYDSSIVPAATSRYGWNNFPREIIEIDLKNHRSIIEAPIAVTNILWRSVPVCGGGYLRLFPYWYTKFSMKKILRIRPSMVYLHPYEIDTMRYPEYYFEAMKSASFNKQFRVRSFWVNRKTVYPKLENLLKSFSFKPLIDIIQDRTAQCGLNSISINK